MAGNGLRLIADIGGTNARFALVRTPGVPEAAHWLRLADFAGVDDAIHTYLANQSVEAASLTGMTIAAAGPVRAGRVAMTNAAWHLDQTELSRAFGGVPVRLVNDLAAVAMALPFLEAGDLMPFRTIQPASEPQPLLAINAGTGLGAAVAIPSSSGWSILATEAGHMRLGALDDEDLRLFRGLTTVEDLIAGPGWECFCKKCPSNVNTSELYSRVLGRFAGDMVLATGAWGGVFFCGGVLNGWDRLIVPEALLASFDNHGLMSDLLESVPVYRVTAENPALKGLALAEAG